MNTNTSKKQPTTLRAARAARKPYSRILPAGLHRKLRERIATLRENVAAQ